MATNPRPAVPYQIYADKGIQILDVDGNVIVTITSAGNIQINKTAGIKIGTAITEKLGFFAATPIAQPASASQAAVVTTAPTNSTPYGFSTSAQALAIVTLVNELRAELVLLGLIKGAA